MDTCPHCASKRIWVHDHRIQKIKDTYIHGKKCLIRLGMIVNLVVVILKENLILLLRVIL
ncbi:transposase family protein [Peptoniphilus grossensis]|uniref:transposase family protein n=1 Tax=Peptoniphilus grossensis TaxID=1465756 RepID=UPI003999E4BA